MKNLVETAIACLRLTTAGLPELQYPEDAEEHFDYVRRELAPWWTWQEKRDWFGDNWTYLEDKWHMHFEGRYNRSGGPLRDLFGP